MKSHIAKAKYNEKFLGYIAKSKDGFFDWMVTVAFYAALHYLRTFLKLKGFTPGSSHFDLEKAIDQNNPRCLLTLPKEIYLCYRRLYEQSRSARYNTVVYSSDLQQKLIMLESKRAKNG